MIEQVLLAILPTVMAGLTSVQTIAIFVILLILWISFAIFKKKLPFIITTRKTLQFIESLIKNTDKDIVDINSVYSVQLDGIIISGLTPIMTLLFAHIYKSIKPDHIRESSLAAVARLITFEARDAVRQLSRENGFIDMLNDKEFTDYTKSKEFVLYEIIDNNIKIFYTFNNEDCITSYINNESNEVTILKSEISKSYNNLFKNIQIHLLKCREKTNELIKHNEDTIKEYI